MLELKHIVLFFITLYWSLIFYEEPFTAFGMSFICGIIINSFQYNNYTFKYTSNIGKKTFKLTLINMILIIITLLTIIEYQD